MLGQPKPFASLSGGLLARKGAARPAMRRQAAVTQPGDELGWNDMGEPPAPKPPVLVAREELVAEIEAPRDVSLNTAKRLERETRHQAKAAFTLRLDEDRHLRLRLASATRHRSAQQLMTQALDALLDTMPEVDALARQVDRPKR